jgi:hypothetical protein
LASATLIKLADEATTGRLMRFESMSLPEVPLQVERFMPLNVALIKIEIAAYGQRPPRPRLGGFTYEKGGIWRRPEKLFGRRLGGEGGIRTHVTVKP